MAGGLAKSVRVLAGLNEANNDIQRPAIMVVMLTPLLAALGKTLVLALLGDLFRLSCLGWGGLGWG